MTPTEQDKMSDIDKLEKRLAEWANRVSIGDLMPDTLVRGAVQLITADRKRVALETLLDVKSNSTEAYVGEDWWDDDNIMDNSAYEIPQPYLDNRIAELKAQQEYK